MSKKTTTDLTNLDLEIDSKIFFIPLIFILLPDEAEEMLLYTDNESKKLLDNVWAGRLLPNQSVREGVLRELNETLGYTGRFVVSRSDFFDTQKDKQGNSVNRYKIQVILLDKVDLSREVMNCKLVLGGNTNNWDALSRERIVKGFPVRLSNKLADLANEGVVTVGDIFAIWNSAVKEGLAASELSGYITEQVANFSSQTEIVQKYEELTIIHDRLLRVRTYQTVEERTVVLNELIKHIKETAKTYFNPEHIHTELIHVINVLRVSNGFENDKAAELVLRHQNQDFEDWLKEDTTRTEDVMIETRCPLFSHSVETPEDIGYFDEIQIGLYSYFVKLLDLKPMPFAELTSRISNGERPGTVEYLVNEDGVIG